jgi:hypothetical protein
VAISTEPAARGSDRTPGFAALAWLTLIVVLAGLTSFVAAGFYLAVVLGIAALVVALRRSTAWAIRLPLLITAVLVTVTLVAWAVQSWL